MALTLFKVCLKTKQKAKDEGRYVVCVGGVRTEGVIQGVWWGRSEWEGGVTQVGDTDTSGGTVQSPYLNLQTNPA